MNFGLGASWKSPGTASQGTVSRSVPPVHALLGGGQARCSLSWWKSSEASKPSRPHGLSKGNPDLPHTDCLRLATGVSSSCCCWGSAKGSLALSISVQNSHQGALGLCSGSSKGLISFFPGMVVGCAQSHSIGCASRDGRPPRAGARTWASPSFYIYDWLLVRAGLQCLG